METAKRMKYFEPSALTVQAGKNTINFTLGSPDIPPEKDIMDVIQAQAGIPANYKYAVRPLPQLVKAIQDWYQTRYGVALSESEICLLQGSQEALVNLPLVFCDPGTGILIPDPYYPIYAQAPRLAEASVIMVPLTEENHYLMDLDAISEADRENARLMLVSYPNNPTGAVADDAFYEKLIRFAKENDILVVHDNAYSELVFNGCPGKSFLSYPGAREVGVELNSFSKTYGMAGARLGVLCGNEQAVTAYKRLKSNLDYGIFLPIQYGGIEALQHGGASIVPTRQTYERRQKLAAKLFTEAGWPMEPSPATMFMWPSIPEGFESCEQFAKELAEKAGVLVTPGTAFGLQGKGHVRIALVQSEEEIEEAAKRIHQFLAHE